MSTSLRAYLDLKTIQTAGFTVGKNAREFHYVEIPQGHGPPIQMVLYDAQGFPYAQVDPMFLRLPRGIASHVIRVTSHDTLMLTDAQGLGLKVQDRRVSKDGKCTAVVNRGTFHDKPALVNVFVTAPNIAAWTRFHKAVLHPKVDKVAGAA